MVQVNCPQVTVSTNPPALTCGAGGIRTDGRAVRISPSWHRRDTRSSAEGMDNQPVPSPPFRVNTGRAW